MIDCNFKTVRCEFGDGAVGTKRQMINCVAIYVLENNWIKFALEINSSIIRD